MIPKIIHYIWFGGNPIPELLEKCINSWKKIMPDYDIIKWDELNFDIQQYKFIRDAYEKRMYAFASDMARYIILYDNGGIFLDCDVEVLKPFDPLLSNKVFFANAVGVGGQMLVSPGLIMGAEMGDKFIKEMIEVYKNMKFDSPIDQTSPLVLTHVLKDKGLKPRDEEQILEGGIRVYPSSFFDPIDHNRIREKLIIKDNTYSIHWGAESWISHKSNLRRSISLIIRTILGNRIVNIVKKVIQFVFGLFVIFSCEKENDDNYITGYGKEEIEMLSFRLSTPSGEEYYPFYVNDSTIHINVPSKTDCSRLVSLLSEKNEYKVYIDSTNLISGESIDYRNFALPRILKIIPREGVKHFYKIVIYDLPVLLINTPGDQEIQRSIRTESCLAKIIIDGNVFKLGTLGIRGRGNSTWAVPKKPYNLGFDEKVSILGMKKSKHYVLLAKSRYYDPTLCHNATALKLSKLTDYEWTPGGVCRTNIEWRT